MVREVEFSNFVELFGDQSHYLANVGDNPLIYGSLADGGKTLTVNLNINNPVTAGAKRIVYLYFGNIDFESRLTDYIELPDYNMVDGAYVFDLSKVLTIPRKIYNTRGTSEIVIELYTYEANITTDYGTKRLSVPYSIDSSPKYEYDQSTDGIYRIYVVDIAPWNSSTIYNSEDIVVHNDVLYMSLYDNNQGNIPPDPILWAAPDKEAIIDYIYGTTSNPPLASIISDMLISRYAKYNLILNSMTRIGFKPYDNEFAFQKTALLQMFREKAMFHLMNHKPIDAAAALQQLKLAYSDLADTTNVRTYNIKYTL